MVERRFLHLRAEDPKTRRGSCGVGRQSRCACLAVQSSSCVAALRPRLWFGQQGADGRTGVNATDRRWHRLHSHLTPTRPPGSTRSRAPPMERRMVWHGRPARCCRCPAVDRHYDQPDRPKKLQLFPMLRIRRDDRQCHVRGSSGDRWRLNGESPVPVAAAPQRVLRTCTAAHAR